MYDTAVFLGRVWWVVLWYGNTDSNKSKWQNNLPNKTFSRKSKIKGTLPTIWYKANFLEHVHYHGDEKILYPQLAHLFQEDN